MLYLNVGSGQRRFPDPWINIDCVSREGQVPDIVCRGEDLPYGEEEVQYVCLIQVLEHYGCNESKDLIAECHRVLCTGGKLIVSVPNLRALAARWLSHQINNYTFLVNLYGAYQGEETDRHRWNFVLETLIMELKEQDWESVRLLHPDRIPPGADIPFDWWILNMECIK